MDQECPCGVLIKQIHGAMEKHANNALRDQDMTMAQVGILLELHKTPGGQRTMKELEQILHVAQSTVVGIVSRLKPKGFIACHGDSTDKRVKWVQITPAGEAVIEGARQFWDASEAQLLQALTDTERETLRCLLQKVHDSLD